MQTEPSGKRNGSNVRNDFLGLGHRSLETMGALQLPTIVVSVSNSVSVQLEKGMPAVRRKLQRLLGAVQHTLPEFTCVTPVGGFSLWLESHLLLEDTRLLERAIRHGVSFDPGQQFRATPSPNLAIRLCYSAVPEVDIERGVLRIARALQRLA